MFSQRKRDVVGWRILTGKRDDETDVGEATTVQQVQAIQVRIIK